MSMPSAPCTHADPLGTSGHAVPFSRSPSSSTYTESARTRFVCPFLLVAMDRILTPVLLMKSLTSIAGDMLLSVLSPAISQNRCPNSGSGLYANSAGLRSFSIRSVARPLNGEALLSVGVVEYRAKIESLAHGPPAGRHTVPTYCGRSDT